jgi:putative glutamine amidotransferase
MKIALPFGRTTPEAKREPYRKSLHAVGISFEKNPLSLAGLGGLMLAGGPDVDPARYNQENLHSEKPDKERDEREALLLRDALERDIPILAICRGMQLLNVCLGGTLTQHIEGHRVDESKVHGIEILEGTKLASILKVGGYPVNSRHHQCVARLGQGLVQTATATDGIIEALELPGKRFVVAVQWHPEDRLETADRNLFEAFAQAVHAVIATARA